MSQPYGDSTPLPSNAVRRGVAVVVTREDRFLVIRRSVHVRAPGAYCFPGGHIEPGETEQEAVVREMLEELQAQATPLRRLWRGVTPWGVELAWWLADLEGNRQLVADPLEVASFHWFTSAEMLALPTLLTSNRQFLQHLEHGRVRLEQFVD